MKNIFLFAALALSFSAYSQIYKSTDDLFAHQRRDVQGKSSTQIVRESLDAYERFVMVDVNSTLYSPYAVIDGSKAKELRPDRAQDVIDAAESNPVVALYQYSKYDKANKGIGFCFGRAMFTHLFLASAKFNRSNIKKAFVVGPMSNGAWAWHVTTIVQSKDARGKENWLAIDPVVGRVMDVKAWYKHWVNSSDDGKLKLYITDSGKFAAAPSTYDETNKTNAWYNNYFLDMDEWFKANDVRDALRL